MGAIFLILDASFHRAPTSTVRALRQLVEACRSSNKILIPLLRSTVPLPSFLRETKYLDIRTRSDIETSSAEIASLLRPLASESTLQGEVHGPETDLPHWHPRSEIQENKAVCHQCTHHHFEQSPEDGVLGRRSGAFTRSEVPDVLRRDYWNQLCRLHGELVHSHINVDGDCPDFTPNRISSGSQ